MSHPIPRWSNASALVLAPAFGLVAACATPGLSSTTHGELVSIAAHPERFHMYAVAILVSGYLTIPAFFGLMSLMRGTSPRWTYLAGGLAQIGIVVAVGDAAVELMYWKMGSHGADLAQMTALSDRYEAGTGWIYGIGGLAFLAGSVALGAGLWRSGTLPRWAAAGVPVSVVVNVAGFAAASQPVLVASYALMLVVLGRAAVALLDADSSAPEARSPRPAVVAQAR
jgi:hypothetical protein